MNTQHDAALPAGARYALYGAAAIGITFLAGMTVLSLLWLVEGLRLARG